MDKIPNNKLNILQGMNVSVDVKKAKDVLGKDTVKAKDILGGQNAKDSLIKKMSDIFPQTTNNDDVLS